MSNIFDVEDNRSKCQKFTPVDIVNVMLDLVGYKNQLMGKKVLENSFGSGNILIEIVKRYITDCISRKIPKDKISEGLSKDIFGIEYDKKYFNKCKRLLNKIASEYGLTSVKWNIHNGDALKWKYREKFDYIIGNPPYISYKCIDKDSKEMIKSNFTSCQCGKFDYCYAFIELGINNLSENGKMIQLVPSNIFKNVFAEQLREMLKPHISVIWEYPEQNFFESTLTSSSIFLYEHDCISKTVKYKNITGSFECEIDRDKLNEKWIFSEKDLFDDEYVRFGDCFNASIVIATLCNKAFIVNRKQIEEFELEGEIIRSAVSPRSLRYKRDEYIIFPYTYDNGELKRFDSESFSRLFPHTEQYLRRFSSELDARNSDKNSEWFEYGRSQALSHLNKSKLLLSTIVTDKVEIYSLDEETIPYSGIYITQTNEDYDLKYAEDILKSREFMNYVKKIGIPVSGSSIRITCKDINNYRFIRR